MNNRILLAWFYFIGILGLDVNDVILTSFPKSGNTWVRYFLCNLISLTEWNGEEVSFPRLDETMPELGRSNLLASWNHEVIPRVVKTHKEYLPLFRGCRAILLIRDPRDVMTSFFFYERGKAGSQVNYTFSEFIRNKDTGIRAWACHFKSWKPNANIIVKFEDLKEDDVGVFQELLSGINVDVNSETIKEAARRSRFEKMKRAEEKYGIRSNKRHFQDGSKFMRKGDTGTWEDLFSKQDLTYTREVLKEECIEAYDV